jgi:hypothetical protein
MEPDEKKEIVQLRQDVSRLTKLTQELVYAITGSSAYDQPGLLQRQKLDEDFRQRQERSNYELKELFVKELNTLRQDVDAKFILLGREFNVKFKAVEKLETYFNLITNKTLWKILIVLVVAGGLLITYAKGGYELLIKLLKQISIKIL